MQNKSFGDLLAARGYFVLHPSVSFETGYPGEAWEKGVLSAVNSLIERGLVDEKQLGVFGTSYGGYATNLLITQTNRFAAAVNISGKVNIISFLGDSPKIGTRNYNAAEMGQDRIGATLWQAPMKYIQHSAVMFADRIHTPLLMLTGKQDYNVPDTNEREMYYALRRLGTAANTTKGQAARSIRTPEVYYSASAGALPGQFGDQVFQSEFAFLERGFFGEFLLGGMWQRGVPTNLLIEFVMLDEQLVEILSFRHRPPPARKALQARK